MKLKFKGFNPDVINLINSTAEHLEFYDPRFPEESQATGYHAFREMCLMKEQICSLSEFDEYRDMEDINKLFSGKKCPIGYYLLSRIHPNARAITLDAVKKVRDILSKGEASKVKIKKKVR